MFAANWRGVEGVCGLDCPVDDARFGLKVWVVNGQADSRGMG